MELIDVYERYSQNKCSHQGRKYQVRADTNRLIESKYCSVIVLFEFYLIHIYLSL